MSDYTNEKLQFANDLSKMLNEYLSARESQEIVELTYLAMDGVKTVRIINPHYKKPKKKMLAYVYAVLDSQGKHYDVAFFAEEMGQPTNWKRAPWLDGELDE